MFIFGGRSDLTGGQWQLNVGPDYYSNKVSSMECSEVVAVQWNLIFNTTQKCNFFFPNHLGLKSHQNPDLKCHKSDLIMVWYGMGTTAKY